MKKKEKVLISAEEAYELGNRYDAGNGVAQDRKKAMQYWRQAVKDEPYRWPEAQYQLAQGYYNGDGVRQSDIQARKRFRLTLESMKQNDWENASREELEKLAGGRTIAAVIVDPSAASFIEVLRRHAWKVIKADNDVLSGIRLTSDALKEGRIVICEGCADALREMDEYVWDLSSGNKDRVKKEHDHAMDDMRYFVSTVLKETTGGFAACVVERRN